MRRRARLPRLLDIGSESNGSEQGPPRREVDGGGRAARRNDVMSGGFGLCGIPSALIEVPACPHPSAILATLQSAASTTRCSGSVSTGFRRPKRRHSRNRIFLARTSVDGWPERPRQQVRPTPNQRTPSVFAHTSHPSVLGARVKLLDAFPFALPPQLRGPPPVACPPVAAPSPPAVARAIERSPARPPIAGSPRARSASPSPVPPAE
jgi:hypothetical protein